MEKRGSMLMNRYEIGKQLGQGTFAKVYHARNLKTSSSVAIKVVDKEKVLKAGMVEQIKREISVMKRIRHPNVVELYEVLATKGKIYFVMEYVKGGELFHKVVRGRLKEDVARKYFQQLIGAVDYCHRHGVYHRDLKLENVLVDENGDVKVSDFGLSALAGTRRQDGLLHTMCGTPAYVSPEVISRKGYDGAKSDIWSCGVILFVSLAGFLPFQDTNLMEMYRKIRKAEFKFPAWFNSDARKLITRMLDPNPNSRISMGKITEHRWFCQDITRPAAETRDLIAVPSPKSEPLTRLNAFDLISHSQGLNLSGLFGEPDRTTIFRFTAAHSAVVIMGKLQEAAKVMELDVSKVDGGYFRLEGHVSIDVEVFEVTESVHLLEIKKCDGETQAFRQLVEQQMRPLLL